MANGYVKLGATLNSAFKMSYLLKGYNGCISGPKLTQNKKQRLDS